MVSTALSQKSATSHTIALKREGAAFLALAVVQVTLAVFHTPGRDELQAWLIARDSDGFGALLANMRNEGHPPLWHALLMITQSISGSAAPGVLSTFQLLISLSVAAVVIYRAPFPLWLRVLVCLNYFVLFEYGTMARAYGLGLLAAVLYAADPRHRLAWLWLALMPHVSLHFALLGGAIGLWHLLTIDRDLKGPAFALASALAALWFMWPDPTSVPAAPPNDLTGKVLTAIVNLGSLAVPASTYGGWNFFFGGSSWLPFNLAGVAAVVVALALLLRHRLETLVLGFGLLVALFGLSCFVFYCFARHYGVLVIFVLLVAWQYWQDPGFSRRAFVAVSLWLAAAGLIIGAASIVVPYSQHQNAAKWIRAHGLESRAWAAYPPHVQIEPSAWLDTPVYDLVKQCRSGFPRWTHRTVPKVGDPSFASLLQAAVASHGGTMHLLLEGDQLQPLPGIEIAKLAEFPQAAYSEVLRIYRITRTDALPGPSTVVACSG